LNSLVFTTNDVDALFDKNQNQITAQARKGIQSMNDQQLDKKVREDAAKVKKDLNTLLEHSAARLGRFETQFGKSTEKSKKEMTSWVEENLAQLSKSVDGLTGTAKDSVEDVASSVKKSVGYGLKQYNAKAKEVANQFPNQFGKKAVRFPWVTLSIVLVVGLLLGILVRPTQPALG
jgi:ElaB/YqjD/DUF883 family membrane-anchored ribosome-binding protein